MTKHSPRKRVIRRLRERTAELLAALRSARAKRAPRDIKFTDLTERDLERILLFGLLQKFH